nr:wsv103 [Shrimp white spot syndrome virus]
MGLVFVPIDWNSCISVFVPIVWNFCTSVLVPILLVSGVRRLFLLALPLVFCSSLLWNTTVSKFSPVAYSDASPCIPPSSLSKHTTTPLTIQQRLV